MRENKQYHHLNIYQIIILQLKLNLGLLEQQKQQQICYENLISLQKKMTDLQKSKMGKLYVLVELQAQFYQNFL